MTLLSSPLTRAPMTPSDVRRKNSNGRDRFSVDKKGYKKSGICALRNAVRVFWWLATH